MEKIKEIFLYISSSQSETISPQSCFGEMLSTFSSSNQAQLQRLITVNSKTFFYRQCMLKPNPKISFKNLELCPECVDRGIKKKIDLTWERKKTQFFATDSFWGRHFHLTHIQLKSLEFKHKCHNKNTLLTVSQNCPGNTNSSGNTSILKPNICFYLLFLEFSLNF